MILQRLKEGRSVLGGDGILDGIEHAGCAVGDFDIKDAVAAVCDLERIINPERVVVAELNIGHVWQIFIEAAVNRGDILRRIVQHRELRCGEVCFGGVLRLCCECGHAGHCC